MKGSITVVTATAHEHADAARKAAGGTSTSTEAAGGQVEEKRWQVSVGCGLPRMHPPVGGTH